MTQAELATKLRVQPGVVSRIESGGRADPRLSTVIAIARALSVSIDGLVAEAGLLTQTAGSAATRSAITEAVRRARTARKELASLDAALEEVEKLGPGRGR